MGKAVLLENQLSRRHSVAELVASIDLPDNELSLLSVIPHQTPEPEQALLTLAALRGNHGSRRDRVAPG